MKIEIKSRFTGAILFSHECGGNTLKVTLTAAIKARAYLGGADLRGAYLGGAYLRGAYLRGADLRGAYLGGAYLGGAYLDGAYLDGADLLGADLRGAYLRGADLDGKKLIGDRPILQIGPIGSRADYLIAYLTDAGIMIRAGCFYGTRDKFAAQVEETHGDNQHGRDYAAALAMIDAHATLWTPAFEAKEAA